MKNVTILVGSLRRESINRKLAKAIVGAARGKLAFSFTEIGDLPLYNDDLWASPPAAVTRFKKEIAATDAILLVTPEYNRSLPAVLKNAIDWGSKPKGENVWAGKPVAVAGTSVGAIGAAVAQAHLRSVMIVLDAVVMGQPEVQIAWRPDLGTEEGMVADPAVASFLGGFADRFGQWVEKVGG
jgi:chromate reductase